MQAILDLRQTIRPNCLLPLRGRKGQSSAGTRGTALRPPPSKPAVKVAPLPPGCGGPRRRSRCTLPTHPFRSPANGAGLARATPRRPDRPRPAHLRDKLGQRRPRRSPLPARAPNRYTPQGDARAPLPALPAPPAPPLTPLRAPRARAPPTAAGGGRRRPRGPGEPRCRRRPPPGCCSPHRSPPARAAEGPRRAAQAERWGCCDRLAAASPSSCQRLMCAPPWSLRLGRRRSSSPLSNDARGPTQTPPAGRVAAHVGRLPVPLLGRCWARGLLAGLYPGRAASSGGGAARTPRGLRHRPPPGGQQEGESCRWPPPRRPLARQSQRSPPTPPPAPRRPLPHGPALPRRRGRASLSNRPPAAARAGGTGCPAPPPSGTLHSGRRLSRRGAA